MASATRRIGLSLGADICWPICFEEILARLKLLPEGGSAEGTRAGAGASAAAALGGAIALAGLAFLSGKA